MKTKEEIEKRIERINEMLNEIIDFHTILKLKAEKKALLWVLENMEENYEFDFY